jgi:prolyl 4-hydroxylase
MGQCRAACKDCKACKAGNYSCYMENRKSAGYLVVEEGEMEAWGTEAAHKKVQNS